MLRKVCFALIAGLALACSKAQPPASARVDSAIAATPAAGATETCPATGQWAECSILYRLERSGFVAKVDSGAKPKETTLTGKPMVITIGRGGALEVYVYPDSVARIADGAKLDRAHLVNATAEQTIERERTLIESSNIIGLLTSISSHQRERVSDAFMAGPPQPKKP